MTYWLNNSNKAALSSCKIRSKQLRVLKARGPLSHLQKGWALSLVPKTSPEMISLSLQPHMCRQTLGLLFPPFPQPGRSPEGVTDSSASPGWCLGAMKRQTQTCTHRPSGHPLPSQPVLVCQRMCDSDAVWAKEVVSEKQCELGGQGRRKPREVDGRGWNQSSGS